MPVIYHVTSVEEWNQAKKSGSYSAPSLATEGFIHCSQSHQVEDVLKRYFNNKTGLVKLIIDTEKLSSPFVYEWSPSNTDEFPHIYGPLNIDSVIEVVAL